MIDGQDAADAIVCCLENPDKVGVEVFLVGDGVPFSRNEIISFIRASSKYR